MTYNEIKQIIINNQMTYKDFVNYFNISIDAAIEIFRKLDLKKCSKGKDCINSDGSVQSRQNFYNDKSKHDGLSSQCVCCQKRKDYQYHQMNKEHYNQRSRQYRQKNKEYFNQLYHQYYQENRKYLRKTKCEYYHNNKEHCNQRNKKYNKYYFKCFAKFNSFNDQISYAEDVRRDPNNSELLQIKCTYCNSWFNPTNLQIQNRISALEGKHSLGSENRFYCSNECKQDCPIHRQHLYSKDDPRYLDALGSSREVQPELRQLVFERDNWICQKCDTHKDNLPVGISLHCHHIEGIRHEPLESADTDMCLTVCSECHKEIHQIPGCTYQDMQCKNFNKEFLI